MLLTLNKNCLTSTDISIEKKINSLAESVLSVFSSNVNISTWFLKLICCPCLKMQTLITFILNTWSIFLLYIVQSVIGTEERDQK